MISAEATPTPSNHFKLLNQLRSVGMEAMSVRWNDKTAERTNEGVETAVGKSWVRNFFEAV